MIFEVPFGIVFSSFSWMSKNHEIDDSSTLSLVFGHQKPLIFRLKFHCFFMFFQNRSRGPFLEGPGADLYWKVGFWCHFRFSGFPERWLLDTLFVRNVTGSSEETVPELTFSNLFLKIVFFFDFVIAFWLHLGRFWLPFGILLASCWSMLVHFAPFRRPKTDPAPNDPQKTIIIFWFFDRLLAPFGSLLAPFWYPFGSKLVHAGLFGSTLTS